MSKKREPNCSTCNDTGRVFVCVGEDDQGYEECPHCIVCDVCGKRVIGGSEDAISYYTAENQCSTICYECAHEGTTHYLCQHCGEWNPKGKGCYNCGTERPIKDQVMDKSHSEMYAQIQSLPFKRKLELLWEYRCGVFALANSFAGEETGGAAVKLHEASNIIMRVFCALAENDKEEVEQMSHEGMVDFFSRMPKI